MTSAMGDRVQHTPMIPFLQISLRIWNQIQNNFRDDPGGGWISFRTSQKNKRMKISCYCPFKWSVQQILRWVKCIVNCWEWALDRGTRHYLAFLAGSHPRYIFHLCVSGQFFVKKPNSSLTLLHDRKFWEFQEFLATSFVIQYC